MHCSRDKCKQGIPPELVTLAEALFPPLHNSFTCEVVESRAVGSVMIKVVTTLQLFASVTVTE